MVGGTKRIREWRNEVGRQCWKRWGRTFSSSRVVLLRCALTVLIKLYICEEPVMSFQHTQKRHTHCSSSGRWKMGMLSLKSYLDICFHLCYAENIHRKQHT